MLRRGVAIATLAACLTATSSQAQSDLSQDEWIEVFRTHFQEKPYLDCYANLDSLNVTTLSRADSPSIELEALRLVSEAIRIQCERNRLTSEQTRLLRERDRLLAEAERLDELWLDAHNADPEKYPDTPGRDRSQVKLRSDARLLLDGAGKITHDVEGLQFGSQRLLRLAMAVDSGVQADLLRRILGGDPIPTG